MGKKKAPKANSKSKVPHIRRQPLPTGSGGITTQVATDLLGGTNRPKANKGHTNESIIQCTTSEEEEEVEVHA